MKVVAVVMAGGRGERFWPLSRQRLPKQFIPLIGPQTMLQETLERIYPLVAKEDILVVTGREFTGLVQEQTGLPLANILAEPEGRDTAACIGLATVVLQERFPGEDPVMLILPADHMVQDREAFSRVLGRAVEWAAQQSALVTIGIPPIRPETGYGYIECGPLVGEDPPEVYRAERFTEKPDAQTAAAFLQAGNYFWNSGMFIWRISVIWAEFQRHLPELVAGLEIIRQAWRQDKFAAILADVFPGLPRISIDYGVMEKADEVYMVKGDFGWDDVGVWSALSRIYQAEAGDNVVAGPSGVGSAFPEAGRPVFLDCQGCLVYPAVHRLVAAIGVEDLIIVDTPDSLLVCRKGEEDRLKELLSYLRETGREEYI